MLAREQENVRLVMVCMDVQLVLALRFATIVRGQEKATNVW